MNSAFSAEEMMWERTREWREMAEARQLESDMRSGSEETDRPGDEGKALLLRSVLQMRRRRSRRRTLRLGPLFIAW